MDIDRQNQRSIGTQAERMAEEYLLAKGFKIVKRNHRFKRAEVDLIMDLDEELLVFVEVKFRANDAFGYPETFVSEAQAQRIVDAADAFIHDIGWTGRIRFDIISIEGEKALGTSQHRLDPANWKLTHFEDAFF